MLNITKGKWEATPIYGDHWLVSVDGRTVVDCFSNEANARLTAEAPEMYELIRDTWERDWKTFVHSLNRERRERFQRMKALINRIEVEEAQ